MQTHNSIGLDRFIFIHRANIYFLVDSAPCSFTTVGHKGQLISKGHVGVFKSPKKGNKLFEGSLPKPLKCQIKK